METVIDWLLGRKCIERKESEGISLAIRMIEEFPGRTFRCPERLRQLVLAQKRSWNSFSKSFQATTTTPQERSGTSAEVSWFSVNWTHVTLL